MSSGADLSTLPLLPSAAMSASYVLSGSAQLQWRLLILSPTS